MTLFGVTSAIAGCTLFFQPLTTSPITTNTMAAASHPALNGGPALLHFARRQDVVAWAPTRLGDGHHRSVRNVTE